MPHPILPPGATVSLTLSGIPADLYLRLLLDAGRAGRGLRAEVLQRLQAPPVAILAADEGANDMPLSRPAAARS
jgi:hypothetical protein